MTTFFFPFCPEAEPIVRTWVRELTGPMLFGPDGALFPKTKMGLAPNGGFKALGIERTHRAAPKAIRRIVADAFANAGLPSYSPHGFRHTLAIAFKTLPMTLEKFEAWSENLGHDDPKTTLQAYGGLTLERRASLLLKSE